MNVAKFNLPSKAEVSEAVKRQREFFASGETRSIDFRRAQLKTLRKNIAAAEGKIFQALIQDLGKCASEAFPSELGTLYQEIDLFVANLDVWNHPQHESTSLMNNGPLSSSSIAPVPFGEALIIGPWNYPINLVLHPLIACLGAGNTAIIKPSELAPSCSRVVCELIKESFLPEYVTTFEGGRETVEALLSERHDFIFFTGGNNVGKIIGHTAVDRDTPYVLELGGQSHCLVDGDLSREDLERSARKIAHGKGMNAGQSCIAPNHLIWIGKDAEKKTFFIKTLRDYFSNFYGAGTYGKIVNENHYDRLLKLLPKAAIDEKQLDRNTLHFPPVVLENAQPGDSVMKEEIFGPILPVLEAENYQAALLLTKKIDPRPLAFYIFTNNSDFLKRAKESILAGGLVINDTMIQFVTSLPFGSIGHGAYHGKAGFDVFSHKMPILHKSWLPDLPMRYPNRQTPNRISPLVRFLMDSQGFFAGFFKKR